ncbi:hypothetical protein L596_005160 [Steinernema carpocapsae]|uniref:Uncharacterized protein n=1 Tax=Steinernema carpocapsae TaxID=34508 RepID=A0A4U8UY77_STECR|nr:hypothetical protein L596_005160 [Steinernema carpocapsae]
MNEQTREERTDQTFGKDTSLNLIQSARTNMRYPTYRKHCLPFRQIRVGHFVHFLVSQARFSLAGNDET